MARPDLDTVLLGDVDKALGQIRIPEQDVAVLDQKQHYARDAMVKLKSMQLERRVDARYAADLRAGKSKSEAKKKLAPR